MTKWNYDDAYLRHPINENEIAVFENGSKVKVHNLFIPTRYPSLWKEADLIFCRPAMAQKVILIVFILKQIVQIIKIVMNHFTIRFWECIDELKPKRLFIEVFKSNKERFIKECEQRYKKCNFYINLCTYNNPKKYLLDNSL